LDPQKAATFPKITPPLAATRNNHEPECFFHQRLRLFHRSRTDGPAKRMKSHKKNVEEITFELQNFI